MSQLDGIKERINLLKYWIGIVIGVLLAVSAWLFNNVDTLSEWKLISSAGLIVSCIGIIIMLNNKLIKRIDALEDI